MEFATIRLWELTDRIRSGELAELAPLLLLNEENPTEETIREEADLIRNAALPPEIEADLLGLVLLVASKRFSRQWLRTLFREEIDTMKDLGLIGDWILEGEARGKARGLAEGEAEGTRKTVKRFLVQRFGTLPESLLATIEQADTDACLALLDRGMKTESLTELWQNEEG